MIQKPMDVLEQFPVRKSKKQKQAFRDALQPYVQSLGYECKIEKGSMGSRNIVIGDPETAKHLITAHYDTCAGMPFPNLITPCNFFLFLGYQLLITLVLLIPALVVGLLAGKFLDNPDAWSPIFLVCMYAELFLMMFGPANKNNANDNTSGVVTVLEIAKSLPQAYRDKVCFVLFDLEEAGLFGSASYRNAHKKATQSQLVWNLDCVGDGDEILFFPTKKLKMDDAKMATLRRCCTVLGTKSVSIREKGFSVYPSDQANFPYGVGIAALHKGKLGLYLGRIHTKRDTVLEETNVNILRAAIVSAVTCGAVQ